MNLIQEDLRSARDLLTEMLAQPALIENVEAAARTVVDALRAGNKVLLCGNGGSAADAQHIAAEFVSRFNFDRDPLAAIALTTDTSIITAIGNDYGYEFLFARQVAALAKPGDVFIGITTSGRSPNVLKAVDAARKLGVKTIGLTGNNDSPINTACDIVINIPSPKTPLIQQAHITVGHTICAIAELEMFGGPQQDKQ
ncbi:D-sedoheptulose 7-phosphate isomerase [Bordetella genomosp. 10]